MASYADKQYNKKEYNRQYDKEHYIMFGARLKPELFYKVDDYCKDHHISKAEFISRAIDLLEQTRD